MAARLYGLQDRTLSHFPTKIALAIHRKSIWEPITVFYPVNSVIHFPNNSAQQYGVEHISRNQSHTYYIEVNNEGTLS